LGITVRLRRWGCQPNPAKGLCCTFQR
jgi:hypothetical protein